MLLSVSERSSGFKEKHPLLVSQTADDMIDHLPVPTKRRPLMSRSLPLHGLKCDILRLDFGSDIAKREEVEIDGAHRASQWINKTFRKPVGQFYARVIAERPTTLFMNAGSSAENERTLPKPLRFFAMNSDGVVRFFSGQHSGGEQAQVKLEYASGTASRTGNINAELTRFRPFSFTDRLKEALAAVRPWRVILACALLLVFFLALSAFIMAFNDGDQATTSPTSTTVVSSEASANQTSPTPATTAWDPATSGRPVATATVPWFSAGPSVPKCGANWQRFQSQCYRVTLDPLPNNLHK